MHSSNKNQSKKQAGFWTYFAITISIIVGVLSANASATAQSSHDSFSVEVSGSGKAVLMIPGLMSDARIWRPTADALSNQYQLHIISIAGFAGKPAIEGALLPKVKQQLLNYINEQKLDKPAVIGHSLGAFMAFDLASSAPEQIGTVIAVDGLPYLAPVFTRSANTTVAMMQQQAGFLRQQYQQMSTEQLRAITAQGLFIQAGSEAAQQQVLQMAAESSPTAAGQAIYELLTTDLRSEVHRITSPVVLLGAAGALTSDADRDAAKALYQQQISTIDQAKLVFNQQARHFIMLDQPDWLLAQIRSALQE